MKLFLVKVIVFMIFPTSYFGINMAINRYIYNKQAVTLEDKNILIVGDSHTQLSLNPKYFVNAQNISQGAEPYILTYWKLEKIFQSFLPDTLILGVAPHNISQFNDLKFSNNFSSGMFKRCYTFENINEVSNKILIDYPNYYKVLWKQTAFYPKKNHIHYVGRYIYGGESSNLSYWETAIKRHYYYDEKKLNVSKVAINYLDSIIGLCNSKNIVIVLVSNPVHENYLKNIPTNIMERYIHLLKEYNKNYIVFDKTRGKYPDSLYLNSDHLNGNGAKRFTNELIQYLSNKARTHNRVDGREH